MQLQLVDESTMFRFHLIYKPPPSKRNGNTFNQFLDKFGSLLEDAMILNGKLILTGDFNFQDDNTS